MIAYSYKTGSHIKYMIERIYKKRIVKQMIKNIDEVREQTAKIKKEPGKIIQRKKYDNTDLLFALLWLLICALIFAAGMLWV